MSTLIMISCFALLVLIIASLFIHILLQRQKSREKIYREAMMRESDGNYEEAITLYVKFLDVSGNQKESYSAKREMIEDRIITLKRIQKKNNETSNNSTVPLMQKITS